jgi:Mg-chelatase subunit ChlI
MKVRTRQLSTIYTSAKDQIRAEIIEHRQFLARVGPAEDFASRLMDEQLRARIATLEAELKEPTT